MPLHITLITPEADKALCSCFPFQYIPPAEAREKQDTKWEYLDGNTRTPQVDIVAVIGSHIEC